MKRINVLDSLVKEYFDKYPHPTPSNLLVFLNENQNKITANYMYIYHREDVINELEYCDYDINRIPNDIIEDMTDYYEDQLSDYGCDCGWHSILNNVIEYFEEDLEEYKTGDEEDE